MLVMLGGLPGVGKSALADLLATRLPAVVVSVDLIDDAIVRSGIAMSFETGLAAYLVGAEIARTQLRNGLAVIADAANYLEVGRATWREAAERVGAEVKVIEVICSDERLHRSRLESRQRGLIAYPELPWDDVLARRAQTEPWPEDRLVLDSVEPLDRNVEKAIAFLR